MSNAPYACFSFGMTPKGDGNTCREVFCDDFAAKVRAGAPMVIYLHINRRGGPRVGQLANMMRQIHALEDSLGYSRSKFTCHFRNVDYRSKASMGSVWRVHASKYWLYSIPMLSFYLGEVRQYYRGGKFNRTRRLFCRVLHKNSPRKLFGTDVKKNWVRGTGYFGATVYEYNLRCNPKRMRELGVSYRKKRAL